MFKGGENAGLDRLSRFVSKALGTYVDTRNDLQGDLFSSKMSPWLANGSVSCRKVYWAVRDFEEKKFSNKSTGHYISELYWRDYCRFFCLHHGNKVFKEYGINDRNQLSWKTSQEKVSKWREG
jgi:deoxyribodipyrimidine photo-lyase